MNSKVIDAKGSGEIKIKADVKAQQYDVNIKFDFDVKVDPTASFKNLRLDLPRR